jgi:glycerol-1-phosphatase
LAAGTETERHADELALDDEELALDEAVWLLEVAWLLEPPHPASGTAATSSGRIRRRTAIRKPHPIAIMRSRCPMALSPLLARYDNVLLDLDGCVWVGNACTRGAPEALSELRAAGKALAFVTNDARRSPEDYVRKLWSLGLRASLEEVVTVGAAIQYVLAERGARSRTYVIGSAAIFRHVADSGQRIVNRTDRQNDAEMVVVAGHDAFNYAELQAATRALLGGAEMIAAGRDRTFPTEEGMSPGTGAIVAALEYATGKTAQIVGKPEPQIFRTALDRLGSGRTLVVGDRLDSDLGGAAAAGLDAAIVLTGVTSRADAEAATDPAPVAISADLHSLVLGS